MNYFAIRLAALFTTATQLYALPPFPLHQAVTDRKPELVRMLIANGADPQKRNGHYVTALHDTPIPSCPLHQATREDRQDLIEIMLRYGADIDAAGDEFEDQIYNSADGPTIIQIAAARNNCHLIRFLLERGAKYEKHSSNVAANTPFGAAIETGSLNATRLLLRLHNIPSNLYLMWNAASLAVIYNQPVILQLLFDHSLVLEPHNLLCSAVLMGHKETAQWLLDQQADVIAHGAFVALSDLKTAVRSHMTKALARLLKAGGALHLHQPLAQRLIRYAVLAKDLPTVKLLLSYGMNANANNAGTPLLEDAAKAGSTAVVQAVVDAGADANRFSHSLLHSAVELNDPWMLRLLLGAGADIERTNGGGKTALELAVLRDFKKIVWVLLGRGANIPNSLDEGAQQLLQQSEALAEHWARQVEQALSRRARGPVPELPTDLVSLIRSFAINAQPKRLKDAVFNACITVEQPACTPCYHFGIRL